MFSMRTKLAGAVSIFALMNMPLLASCAQEETVDKPLHTSATDPISIPGKPRMLQSSVSLNDVLSRRVVAESFFEGKDSVAVILIGDRIVYEYQDGRASEIAFFDRNQQPLAIRGSGTTVWVLTDFFIDFKKKPEIIGQANLSIKVNDDQTCEILSKTIYVPGCEPFVGGSSTDSRVQAFWNQIKSSVYAIESKHLQLPSPEYKSMTFELIVGRDPSLFPRYSTPFNGMIVRDQNGKIRHTEAFVRDGADP